MATLTEDEEAELKKKEEIAEKVKLEADEEEALAGATLTDVMALADILNTNPQNFIMDAYSDPMHYYEPDVPNDTSPEVSVGPYKAASLPICKFSGCSGPVDLGRRRPD